MIALLTQLQLAQWFAQFPKTCGCGVRHTARGWMQLRLVGEQITDDEGGVYRAELRDCFCGSTLAIETKISHVPSQGGTLDRSPVVASGVRRLQAGDDGGPDEAGRARRSDLLVPRRAHNAAPGQGSADGTAGTRAAVREPEEETSD